MDSLPAQLEVSNIRVRELRCTRRQHRSSYQSTEVTAPHCFEREVRRHFLRILASNSARAQDMEKITSSENKTPPIGLPNATATPAAAHALRISLVLAALRLYLSKNLEMTFPVQTA